MGAAMSAMMVGQMEMAGMRGMLPPGITTRPSQPNIDFMKSNADLFQRVDAARRVATAVTPAVRHCRAARTSDEALPMPANAGAVLPSSILARLPPLDTIKRGTDCSLGGLQATIEKETAQSHCLAGRVLRQPRRQRPQAHAAEGAILDRLDDTDLESCGMELNMGAVFSPSSAAADAAWKKLRAASPKSRKDGMGRVSRAFPAAKSRRASARSTPTRRARWTQRSGNSSRDRRNRSRRASRRCAPAP